MAGQRRRENRPVSVNTIILAALEVLKRNTHAPKCALPAVGRESVHKLLVWQIHKPIAGGGGSHVCTLQPGKVDNQSVVALPPVVFRGIEGRPPIVGRYPGACLRSFG
jgi:hypothetical protein